MSEIKAESSIKEELKSVIKGELSSLASMDGGGTYVVPYNRDILNNDNFLQELENVVLSYAKPRLEISENIERLERELARTKDDNAELLALYNREDSYNKELMERNKRLSAEVKRLEKGIIRERKWKEKCDHVKVVPDSNGIRVVNLIKTNRTEEGTYVITCCKCGKKF